MRRFLRKIFPYTLGFLLLGLWIELKVRRMPNNYSTKANCFEDFPISEIETLILGSSHALKGIDPSHFSSRTFNYAHVSQSYDIDLAILKSADFQNLKTLILPVSQFSFYTILEEGSEAHRLSKYAIYTPLKISTSFLDRFAISHWTEYRRFVFRQVDSSLCTIEPSGWEPMPSVSSPDQLVLSAKTAFERHSSHGLAFNRIAIDSFEEILTWCELNNVRVVLVSTPCSTDYRKLVINSPQWTQTKNKIREFETVRFLNWLENPPVLFEKDDFHDADHLSAKGAQKLSIELNQWIEAIAPKR
jgi:hypothetical protein